MNAGIVVVTFEELREALGLPHGSTILAVTQPFERDATLLVRVDCYKFPFLLKGAVLMEMTLDEIRED